MKGDPWLATVAEALRATSPEAKCAAVAALREQRVTSQALRVHPYQRRIAVEIPQGKYDVFLAVDAAIDANAELGMPGRQPRLGDQLQVGIGGGHCVLLAWPVDRTAACGDRSLPVPARK